MKFRITLSWSKLVAVLILIAAVYLDIENESIQAFIVALPFITFLITGKMISDYKQKKLKENDIN